jgi:hypothetical protein
VLSTQGALRPARVTPAQPRQPGPPAAATTGRATLARQPSGVSRGPIAVSRLADASPPSGTHAAGPPAESTGGGGGDGDAAHHALLRRLREEQEQLYRLIPHPF